MQSRTPRVPQQTAPHRADSEARLTAELTSVVAGARRRALRDGDRQVDTAHLLHSLIETDPDVRAAFDGGTPQIARVLGYLVQRSIGYGLRWQGAVEDSGNVTGARDPVGLAGWSPAAAAAMERALGLAAARGDRRARGLDLLAVLAADTECRAVEVLRRGGVDTDLLAGRLCAASRQA
ncbi:peptidase [Streptomyces agglomeratus]|uniref:Peptidase n=1 Tax=Streptomyces agglomeratus TaxID=285458 RepID=A0A1E5PEI9_9ACTN|nr:peptidase [Streptomyces agglomeratus]OEJ27960.1 peptidase [Streptomyces agglomeratus]